jgi:hypothetical protein
MNIDQHYLKRKEKWSKEIETVKGRRGEIILKSNAICINEHYYEKNKTAMFVEGNWYALEEERIVKDAYSGKYILIQNATRVTIHKSGENGVVHKATTPWVSGRTIDDRGQVCYEILIMSPTLAEQMGYKECLNSGYFFIGQSPYFDHQLAPEHFNHTQKLTHEPGVNDANIPHNTRYGLASHSFIKTESKRYTFGVEMETATGRIAGHVYKEKLNISGVHDGSITGGEYVTGILTGDQGLIHLKKICNELSKRCTVDDRCGVHVHIGGFIPNKEFTIYSYVLGHLLQDEIYAMLPSSRRNGEYCQPLDINNSTYSKVLTCLKESIKQDKIGYEYQISQAYELIFKWLSNGMEPSDSCNKSTAHPQGRYCGGHGSARYKWLNLIPTNFSKMRFNERESHSFSLEQLTKSSSQTIEFRNHSGTLSYKKIEAWVLLCMSFTWFVEHRKNEILNTVLGKRTLRLKDIIDEACPKSSISLDAYISQRTHLFSGRADAVKADYLADVDEKEVKITEFVKQNFKQCV